MYLGLFRLTHRQVPGEQGTRAAPRRHAWAEARPSRQPYGASPGPGGTSGARGRQYCVEWPWLSPPHARWEPALRTAASAAPCDAGLSTFAAGVARAGNGRNPRGRAGP